MQSLDVWRSLGLWVLCWLSASDVQRCSSKGSCVQWTLRTSDGDSKSSCFALPSLGHPPAVHLVAFLCSVHPDSWLNCPVEPSFCVFICHKVTLDLQVLGLLPHPPHPRKKERRKKKRWKRENYQMVHLTPRSYCKILQLPVFISILELASPKAP